MQLIPDEVVDVLKTSHIALFRAEVYVNGRLVSATDAIPSFKIIDGTVKVDRKADISRTCEFTIADDDGSVIPFHDRQDFDPAFRPKFHPYRGVRYYSQTQKRWLDYYWPLGKFVITECTPKEDGGALLLDVSGEDYARIISDNKWDQPYNIIDGPVYSEAIRQLIIDRADGFVPLFNFEESTVVCPDMTFEGGDSDDPWQDAKKLAEADGKELFIAGTGTFVLRAIPNPTTLGPVWAFNEDDSSVVLDSSAVSRTIKTEDASNGVTVRGSAPWLTYEVNGTAWDDDPSSPTYYLGPYGKHPAIIDDPLVGTQDQAQASAEAKLLDYLGVMEDVSFDALVNPALEQGDCVTCYAPRIKMSYICLLEAFELPFLAEKQMPATTRSRRKLGFNPDEVKGKVKTPAPTPVQITTLEIPDWAYNVAFSFQMKAVGGVVPYRWSAAGLPPGWNIDESTGIISGTVTSEQHPTITIQVVDFLGQTRDSRIFTPDITFGPVVSLWEMPLGQVGVPYTAQLTAVGGTPYGGGHPYHWASSDHPSWMGIDVNGAVTGTPDAAFDGSITAVATDSAANASPATLIPLTISPDITKVVIDTNSLPVAYTGRHYSKFVTASQGVLPYTWSATGLPGSGGWAIDAVTGEISGDPTVTTGTPFTVHVTCTPHSGAAVSKNLTLNIQTPPTSGAPMVAPFVFWEADKDLFYQAPMYACGGLRPYTWDASGLPPGLELDTVGGYLFGIPTTNGTYAITLTAYSYDGTPSVSVTINLVVRDRPTHTFDLATLVQNDNSAATSNANRIAIANAIVANKKWGADFAFINTKPGLIFVGQSATATRMGMIIDANGVGKWHLWGTVIALGPNQPVTVPTQAPDGKKTDAVMMQISNCTSYQPEVYGLGIHGNAMNQAHSSSIWSYGLVFHGLFIKNCQGVKGWVTINNIRGVAGSSQGVAPETFFWESLGTVGNVGDHVYIDMSSEDRSGGPNGDGTASGAVWQGQPLNAPAWQTIVRAYSIRHGAGHYSGGNGWLMPGCYFEDIYRAMNFEAGKLGTKSLKVGHPDYGTDQIIANFCSRAFTSLANGSQGIQEPTLNSYGVTALNCTYGMEYTQTNVPASGVDSHHHYDFRYHIDHSDDDNPWWRYRPNRTLGAAAVPTAVHLNAAGHLTELLNKLYFTRGLAQISSWAGSKAVTGGTLLAGHDDITVS